MSLKTNTIGVDIVSDLFSIQPADGDRVHTLGYSSVGDGGDNLYFYDLDGTGTPDGGFTLPGVGGSLSFSGTVFDGTTGTGRFVAVDQTVAKVRQFGAVGDGVVDDSDAVQRAVDAAALLGKVIVIFNGTDTYALSQPINLEPGTYRGNDCGLTSLNGADWANSYSALYALEKSGIRIEGFEISGDFAEGIRTKDCSHLTIEHCNIHDVGHQSVTQERGFGIRCQGSAGAQQTNLKIVNNTITNILGWGGIAGDFIYVQYTDNVIIKNNVCDTSNRQGIALTNSVNNAVISENILTNVALAGIDIETNNGVENNNRIIITSNVVDEYGMKPSGQTGGQYYGITYGQNVTDSIIGMNMITRADATKSGTYGIKMGADNVGTVVVGNFVDTAENGLKTWNGSAGNDLIVSSNMFTNISSSGLGVELFDHQGSVFVGNSLDSNLDLQNFDGAIVGNFLPDILVNQVSTAAIAGNHVNELTLRASSTRTAYHAVAGNYMAIPMAEVEGVSATVHIAESASMVGSLGAFPSLVDGDTTPSMAGIRAAQTVNTSGTNIYGFDDVIDGALYTVVFTSNDTLMHIDSTDSPDVRLALSGNADYTPIEPVPITFVIDDNIAREVVRG